MKNIDLIQAKNEQYLLTDCINEKIEKFSKIQDDNKISNFSEVQNKRRTSEQKTEMNITAFFNDSFNQIINENKRLTEEVSEFKS